MANPGAGWREPLSLQNLVKYGLAALLGLWVFLIQANFGNGDLLLGFVTIGVGVVLLVMLGVGLSLGNRLRYYYWYLLYQSPFIVLALAILSFVTYRLYWVFGEDQRHSVNGAEIALYLWLFTGAVLLLLYGIDRIRPLTGQRYLDERAATARLEFDGEHSGRVDDIRDQAVLFRFKIHIETHLQFMGSLGIYFIALERLRERSAGRNKGSGVVWTSRRLRPLRLLVLSGAEDGSDPINLGGRIDRFVAADGDTVYVFVGADDPKYFQHGSRFRIALYLSGGGILSAIAATPGPSP